MPQKSLFRSTAIGPPAPMSGHQLLEFVAMIPHDSMSVISSDDATSFSESPLSFHPPPARNADILACLFRAEKSQSSETMIFAHQSGSTASPACRKRGKRAALDAQVHRSYKYHAPPEVSLIALCSRSREGELLRSSRSSKPLPRLLARFESSVR